MYHNKNFINEDNAELYGSYEGSENRALKGVKSSNFTDYLEENYFQLLHHVELLPNVDPTLAGDLMHDVWCSLNERVLKQEDFDEDYVNRNGEKLPVESVVWNIIAQYAKNSRYCKKYTNKVKVNRSVSVDVISLSPALCDEEAGTSGGVELSYRTLSEASLVKSTDVEGLVCEKMTKKSDIKRALEYSLVNTEDYMVSMETLLENIDTVMAQVNKESSTLGAVDKSGILAMLHGTMFKEYTADKDLEYNFRVVLNALREDRLSVMRIYQEVKATLA